MDTSKKKTSKPNPVAEANFLSILTFSYMVPIFIRGFCKGLTEDDLYLPLPEHKSAHLGEKLDAVWRAQRQRRNNSGLRKALFSLFGIQFLTLGVLRLFNEVVLVVLVPLSIGKLVSYFELGQTRITEKEAYIIGTILVGYRFVDALLVHYTMMGFQHTTMKMRVACSALIYRKILRLNRFSLSSGTTVGQVVNLLSNDVSKFDQSFLLANFAWIAPIQAAVGTYLLYRDFGPAAFVGMALLLSNIPLQTWFGNKCSSLRLKIALRTDERVRLMNEIIAGIQVIKMYCWEKPFGKLINLARKREMAGIRSRGYLMGMIYCMEMFITRASVFVTIIAYVLLGNYLTAEKVFTLTAIYSVLRPIITTIFSLSISSLAEVNVSAIRIEEFLLLPEQNIDEVDIQEKIEPEIILNAAIAKWQGENSEPTLKDIHLEITGNQVVAVIGPVGSGKSSLLNVLLKELPLESGNMNIKGTISYASQEPWLFSASVRQNILFGSEYHEERYQKVVQVCALRADFDLFPFGDKTLVGEKGKSLSGGQKARINLARAIYKTADIYLLDDPLSAVDTNVGKHLYEQCIQEYLHDKICILVTHQLQYLRKAHKIIVMDDGQISLQGTYQDLQTLGLNFSHEEEIHQVDKNIPERTVDEEDEDEEGPEAEKEILASGRVKAKLYLSYLRAGGGLCNAIFMLLVFAGAQVVASSADYYVTYWVNLEQNSKGTLPRETIIYTYSAIILAAIIFGIAHGVYFMAFFALASSTLHNLSFAKMIRATMQFFNNNPSGRILNRFSRDLGTIDEYIPMVMYDVLAVSLDLLGAVVLSAMVNMYLLIPCIILMLIFYNIRRFYLSTSRSIKRIEGITRSPIYSHMSATMYGLSTVRAFSAQEVLIQEFDEYQDRHSGAWFLFLTSNRCFGYWIDTICVFFICSAIYFLLYFHQDLYGGDVGLVLTQYVGLTGCLQWGIRQWSELENQMISVERIVEYSKVEAEPVREPIKLSDNWPESGAIQFRDLSLRYQSEEAPVLKQLNITIEPKAKIGIVGRTGAGKSSTITALFQLYPIEGSIVIDGVDTTKIPLEQLRSRISIIPQEPVLFSGTMRKNLDPFEEYSDEILWNALDQVELKDVIAELPSGLHTNVSEGGTNFSVGQRQLVCLARALIRNNKILVMDEATANVDPQTDALIQNTIREKFAECTVLTIAHRLNTVMDSDKILVMGDGAVQEFDHPFTLMQNQEGVLHKLIKTTGKMTSSVLEKIAEENYQKKKRD